MKKILAIVLVLLFVFLSVFVVRSTQSINVGADVFTSGYAKVMTNDCYLFSSPENKTGMFLLEQSYFVKVVDDFDNVFFKVKYLEFEGFVEKSKVCFVEEYPENPFLVGITFDIYDLGNVCLRSSPKSNDDDSNILCVVGVSSKDLTYYGKCSGEEAILGLGNVWFYAGYQDENGNLFKGYIYSPLTRNLSAISSSKENLTLVSVTNFLPVENLLYLNLSTKNMLVAITAIPTLLIVFLMTVPTRIIEKKKD